MASITELPQYRSGPIPDELLALLPDELNLGASGRTVAREDVPTLGPDQRGELWYVAPGEDGSGDREVMPFHDQSPVFGLGPAANIKPFMRRFTLLDKHGMTDNQLERERQRVFGDRGPGELVLSDDEPETVPLMEERWRVWDALTSKAYLDKGPA